MRATPRSGPCAISDRAVRLRCWITRGLSKGLSNLRHELGRTNDSPWFRYTFSTSDFAPVTSTPLSNYDPRHLPAPPVAPAKRT
jgi:hypothetical protein